MSEKLGRKIFIAGVAVVVAVAGCSTEKDDQQVLQRAISTNTPTPSTTATVSERQIAVTETSIAKTLAPISIAATETDVAHIQSEVSTAIVQTRQAEDRKASVTPSLTATPSPTAIETEKPTFTPTPSATGTNTTEPTSAFNIEATGTALATEMAVTPSLTPTPTPETNPTLDPTRNALPVSEGLSDPNVFFVENENGIDQLIFDRFVTGRAAFVDQFDTVDGKPDGVLDFSALWEGRTPASEDLNVSTAPNWFSVAQEGRGWNASQVESKTYRDLDTFIQKPFDLRFWNEKELGGASIVTTARDLKKTILWLAIGTYLDRADSTDIGSEAKRREFLAANGEEIVSLAAYLYQKSGYAEIPSDDQEIAQTPDVLDAYDQTEVFKNYRLTDGRVCITKMTTNDGAVGTDRGAERSNQVETVVTVEYDENLEKTSIDNDQTLKDADLDEPIVLTLTVDRNALAWKGGAFSPTDEGKVVLDVERVANIKDKYNLDRKQPKDDETGKEGAGYFGRWIPCGVTQEGNTIYAATTVPAQFLIVGPTSEVTQVIATETPHAGDTPVPPTKTPENPVITPTPPPQPTETPAVAPTNEHIIPTGTPGEPPVEPTATDVP
ncbi:MAG: hypothetical protein ABI758_02365 [Candidatus Woesebacteria bacterium]